MNFGRRCRRTWRISRPGVRRQLQRTAGTTFKWIVRMWSSVRSGMSWTKPNKLTPNHREAGLEGPHSIVRDQIVAAIVSVVVAPFAGTAIVLSDCPLVLVARGSVVVGTPPM